MKTKHEYGVIDDATFIAMSNVVVCCSPENLHEDGECYGKRLEAKKKQLNEAWKALTNLVARKYRIKVKFNEFEEYAYYGRRNA